MADRATIERVAKILARVNSDNTGESEAALSGTYARMKRDGVTLSDLLNLPEELLFQDALSRLAAHIAKQQKDLSQTAQRRLYAEYLKLIVEKFSPDAGSRGGESNSERDEAARAYEERRREEEARRGRKEPPKQKRAPPPAPPDPPPRPEQKPYSRENGNTANEGRKPPFPYDPDRFPLSFSVGSFFSFLFGSSSFIGCIYSFPKRAFELFFTSCIVGGLTAGALYFALALLYSNTNFAPFAWLFRFLFLSPTFGVSLIIFITAYTFYERGWYPRGPRGGETDAVSMSGSLWRLCLALLWRLYGVWAWISNSIYTLAYNWQSGSKEGASEKPKKSTQEGASSEAKNVITRMFGDMEWYWQATAFIIASTVAGVISFFLSGLLFTLVAFASAALNLSSVVGLLRNQAYVNYFQSACVIIGIIVFWSLAYRQEALE